MLCSMETQMRPRCAIRRILESILAYSVSLVDATGGADDASWVCMRAVPDVTVLRRTLDATAAGSREE